MLTPWRIEKQVTHVPGRWASVTHGEWFVVLNPHGGRMAFEKTREGAEAALTRARAEWRCDCGECRAESG